MMLPRRVAVLGALLACALPVAPVRAADSSLPYATQPAFGSLKFTQPVAVVSPPGDRDRAFVVEKGGRIMVVDLRTEAPTARVFLDLTDRVRDSSSEQGTLALAFHPDWRKNRQFYLWWTSTEKRPREDRLSRFLISATNPDAADPQSEQPIIAQADQAGNHNGGELLFGPDGYLYVSLGDEGAGDDRFGNSQRIDKNFFSGILRLDVDRKPGSVAPNPHPASRPDAYAIPADNPWVGAREFNGLPVDPAKVRTEFWAVGLRNPWRMSFDPATGQLWCGDVGQNSYEEVDIIVRGGNYGWNVREAFHPFAKAQPTPPAPKFLDPVWEYPRSQGISITGGLVYRGKHYADLDGKYLFADYAFARIWALTPRRRQARRRRPRATDRQRPLGDRLRPRSPQRRRAPHEPVHQSGLPSRAGGGRKEVVWTGGQGSRVGPDLRAGRGAHPLPVDENPDGPLGDRALPTCFYAAYDRAPAREWRVFAVRWSY